MPLKWQRASAKINSRKKKIAKFNYRKATHLPLYEKKNKKQSGVFNVTPKNMKIYRRDISIIRLI